MTSLLEGWTGLSRSRRRKIGAAIADKLVAEALAAHPHFSDSTERPRVEIYAATREGERVTAHGIRAEQVAQILGEPPPSSARALELTRMTCRTCGFAEMVDTHETGDVTWRG